MPSATADGLRIEYSDTGASAVCRSSYREYVPSYREYVPLVRTSPGS